MTKFGRRKTEALLAQGRVALNNARDTPEILDLLMAFNYDEAKLQEGQVLFQDLREQHEAQLRLRAQQKEATAAFNMSREAANKTYSRHFKISRVLLSEEPERLARLGLEGPRSKSFGAWQEQARQFYREGLADAELQALLAGGGLSQEVLESSRAQVKATVQARNAQESAKGLAQQSTKDRDAAAETYRQWMRNFYKIAEMALVNQPQWLERLGRRVRS